MDRCSEGARSLARYKGPVIWPSRIRATSRFHQGTAILGGRLVRLAEAQESWSTGGGARADEDWGQTTDYE